MTRADGARPRMWQALRVTMHRGFVPTLTARALQPVVAGLERLGLPAGELLTASGVPAALLRDPDGRVPRGAAARLWAAAERHDPDVGLHVAMAAPVESFEIHAYALLASGSLRDAYRRSCRYQRLIHEGTVLSFEERDDEAVLRHALPGGAAVPRQPAEFLVGAWLRFGRLVSGLDWWPRRVLLAHPAPTATAEHARLLGPVVFGAGATALHVEAAVLDRPNPGGDAGLVGVLDRYAESLLARVPRRPSVAEAVRVRLATTLEAGRPTAARLAHELHMSPRSLHRALAAEGTTLRAVDLQVRQERASALLADGRLSIEEVAFTLGFAELSSFYRAFRRWTGDTPAAFRARARTATGPPPP